MKTLILGGIRSGKSRLAEKLAQQTGKKLIYIATATAADQEMQARIEQHRAQRTDDWMVIEEAHAIGKVVDQFSAAENCILIDCLTLWVTNLLMHKNQNELQQQREALLNAVVNFKGCLLMVGNETSMGIIPNGELTRRFGDAAGTLHQTLAQQCDRVVLTIAGLPLVLKGDN